ncbi:MAG: alcohol dehydrogenase catalytic domain-containing protein [Phycisphaerales bacterium]
MLAVRRSKNEVYLDRDAPTPEPKPGLALIRPTRVLIGPADTAVCRGEIDFSGVMGHQFVGVVEACDDQAWVGKRVVGNINIADPASPLARRGLANHDPGRAILGLRGRDGCLAERFVLETRNLSPVPNEIDDDRAVFAWALAGAIHASQIVHMEGKPYITVLGEGLAGLLCGQVMTRLNASVRLLGTQSQRLELCAKWGIRHRHLDDAGRRQDQDVVIDTTMHPGSLADAMGMVRPMGTIVLASGPIPVLGRAEPLNYAPIAANELRIVGARCGNIGEAIEAMGTGDIDLSGLITRRFRFEEAVNALRTAQDEDQIGVVVQMDG